MFAPRVRGRLPSRPMIYNNAHRETEAWPELKAWLEYLEVSNKGERTIEAYERNCAKILLAFPDKPFNEFTDSDLLAVMATWPKLSRHVYKAPVNGWFKWGYRTRRIPSNPADMLPDIRYKPNRRIIVFEPTEISALRNLPHPHGLLMTILLETGIRRTEARFLSAQRVDFRAQEILVREGAKGKKERLVPMTVGAAAAFHELIATDGINPHEFFWASHPGGGHRVKRDTPMANSTFQRWWVLCLDEAGVTYRKPHTTRHTFATYWLDDRLDDGDVQLMLGHESIRTTRDIYDHRKVSKIGDKMRSFDSDITARVVEGVSAK